MYFNAGQQIRHIYHQNNIRQRITNKIHSTTISFTFVNIKLQAITKKRKKSSNRLSYEKPLKIFQLPLFLLAIYHTTMSYTKTYHGMSETLAPERYSLNLLLQFPVSFRLKMSCYFRVAALRLRSH